MESIPISGVSDQSTGILNLFDQILGQHEIFVLAQTGLLNYLSPFIVHLQTNAQRTLLTLTLYVYPSTETLIRITSTSGQLLLTATLGSNDPNIMLAYVCCGAEGQYFGKLEMNSALTDLYAKSATDVLLLHMKCAANVCFSPQLSLPSNGVKLARIQKSNNVVRLFNLPKSDSQTKFFVIFGVYFLYTQYYAETTAGRIGAYGVAESGCYGSVIAIFFIVVFLIVAAIILTKLSQNGVI